MHPPPPGPGRPVAAPGRPLWAQPSVEPEGTQRRQRGAEHAERCTHHRGVGFQPTQSRPSLPVPDRTQALQSGPPPIRPSGPLPIWPSGPLPLWPSDPRPRAPRPRDDPCERPEGLARRGDDAREKTDDASRRTDDACEKTSDASRRTADASRRTKGVARRTDDACEGVPDASRKAKDASRTTDDASRRAKGVPRRADDASRRTNDASSVIHFNESGPSPPPPEPRIPPAAHPITAFSGPHLIQGLPTRPSRIRSPTSATLRSQRRPYGV